MGAITQFRVMGGAIGLSIVNTAMHGYVKSKLQSVLPTPELDAVLKSAQAIALLDAAHQEVAKAVILDGYNLQLKILAGLAGVQILGSMLMWQRKQITV
jgi:hypothetical protein